VNAVADERTHLCPQCGKPFDLDDKLFDFAIAAHEKDHTPGRNSPADLIRYDDDALMWVCKICGDPLHIGEFTARQQVITHCREKHGSLPASSAPVTARGGRRSSGHGGHREGIAETIGDALEDSADAIGRGIAGAFRFVGDLFSGD
jgi:hypothetical protein